MPGKMERFTQRARRCLSLAQDEAERMQHAQIGAEHILLAMLLEEGGVGGRVLREMGVRWSQVDQIIEKLTADVPKKAVSRMDLSDDAKRTMELAVDEARRMGHHYIGSEHLLLGLLRSAGEGGLHREVLQELAISPDEVRRQTHRILQESPSSRPRRSPRAPETITKTTKTPFLDQIATDLTAQAAAGALDPVIGRDSEIDAVIQTLLRKYRRNPLLVGKRGVGRTAIVRGLALRIANQDVPPELQQARIVHVRLAPLVPGTLSHAQFETRLRSELEQMKSTETILFIEDVHMQIGTRIGGALSCTSLIGMALLSDDFVCIGEITPIDYEALAGSEAALLHSFQPILIEEPSLEETLAIANGLAPVLAAHHAVQFEPDAITAAVTLAARYVPDQPMPAKVLALLDSTAARLRLNNAAAGTRLERDLQAMLDDLDALYNTLDEAARGERQAHIESQEAEIASFRARWNPAEGQALITAADVIESVHQTTGIARAELEEACQGAGAGES